MAAAIWGFGFVAQRVGMASLGPYTFNGIRFMLGAASLVPLILLTERNPSFNKKHIAGGIVAGLVLFVAASFQQVGIVYTTAGKAGFITGLYIIIVPFLSHFLLKHKIGVHIWAGAFLALIGLYLLSITGNFLLEKGDMYVFIGALFWAVHILVIGFFTRKMDSLLLSAIQFLVCSILSLIVGASTEMPSLEGAIRAVIPLLYGGVASVGIAYTLQVVAQKSAHSANASIILSMESLFAVMGGWMLLSEHLSSRGMIGCVLMLAGMIISQIRQSKEYGYQ